MVNYKRDRLFNGMVVILLIIGGLACLLPMLYVIIVSITPYDDYLRHQGMVLIPEHITLSAYKMFLEEPYVLDAFNITLISTLLGTFVNIVLTVLMAYPLAKSDLIGRKLITFFVLIPLLVSGGLIPLYLVVKATGLIDSIWALILPGAVWSYVLIITRTFFSQIDQSLYESARIDGASEVRTLLQIILPVSTPILATIGLMYGVGHWNEYFGGVMYMTDDNKKTLQVILREVLNRSQTTERMIEEDIPSRTLQMAGVVFTAVPVIVVYPFLQKYFIQGIMLGSIKG